MCHSVEMYMPRLAMPDAGSRKSGVCFPCDRPHGPLTEAVGYRAADLIRGIGGRLAGLSLRATLPRPATARRLRQGGAALLLVLIAGCAAEAAPGPERGATGEGPAETQVVDATGLDINVPSFTVRRQGRLMQAEFYLPGGGVQRAVVTARSGRGLDRADARATYGAAYAAAQQIDCAGGQPVLVDTDSATLQEEDRRTALRQGAPAGVFRARRGA